MLDVAIVGAGPAGLTAAIYAKRKGVSVELFDASTAGGKLNEAVLLENFPGFKAIKGAELAQKMKEQVEALGVKINEFTNVESIEKGKEGFILKTDSSAINARSVIIASGASHRKLNVKGADEFEGKGISYCATCDGPLFANKNVAVIGGGNSGAMNALYLSDICKKVYLLEYMPELKCERAYLEEMKKKGITIITNAEVSEFFGDETLKGLKYRERETKAEKELSVEGAFVYIGIKANSELASKLGCELDERGDVKVDQYMQTTVPGVFAAGDVTGIFQQAIVACAQGALAAESAYRYLKKL